MVKIEDVAKKAGVSVTTVSRVLNNRGYISQKTRDAVAQAIEELNYQPNEMARSLFRRKSNMIGLIIPSVSHPFFSELTYYLEYYADQYGYRMLLCNSDRDTVKESKYIDMLKKNQVDAIIMASSVLDVEQYQHLNLPVISFDRIVAESIPIVGSNNFQGGQLAAQLLLEKNCKQIVYINRGVNGPHHQALLASGRAKGFIEYLQRFGIEPMSVELKGASEDELLSFLASHPEIDGVFTSSDVIAAEVIQACKQLNKAIPNDVKLIGYDDTSIASLVTPRITSIKQPIEQMSECAVQLILQKLEGNEVEKMTLFDVSLVERETT